MSLLNRVALASGLALACVSAPARAEDAQAATCVQAHRDAQQLRREEKLVETRSRLVVCAGAACPSLVQQDCTRWLDEVSKSIPSVVVSAKDEGGHELRDVTVSVKDHFSGRAVDGTPIELDPGAYSFHYERPGAKPIDADVVLQTGVRNRIVEVVFPGGKPPPKARPKPPVIAYVLAGTGAVAFASFSYFGLKGRSEYNDLKDSCGTRCPPDAGDSARRNFRISDISLAISALTLGGAAYYFFFWTPSDASRGEQAARHPALQLGASAKSGFVSVTTPF
jgi:hypothetical protein